MSDRIAVSGPLADSAARLLFELFVYCADADDGLGAREVQALQQMLEAPDWCRHDVILAGLGTLRSAYGELWKDYQKKTISRNLHGIGEQLTALGGTPLAADFVAAVRDFLDRLGRNAAPALVRLGFGSLPPAKQKARQEVDGLLAELLGNRPAPAAAEAAKPEPVAASAVAAPPGDLSIWPAAGLGHTPEQTWKRGKTAVRCCAVIPETHDVRTFVFQAQRPVLFAYKPGQFATLELPIDGKTIRRSYTISSSPSRPHAISITVKRVPGGLVSNWLHDNMQAGFEFNLSGPNGEFTCFDAPAPKLLLIAAGSGITPVMSMLRWLVDTASPADIVFLNNVRTPADVIFGRELDYLASRKGAGLKLGIVPAAVEPGQAWNGPVGHFSEQLVRLWAPDFAEREVFVCGPPGYMDCVRTTLERMGLSPVHYHQESFGAPPAQRPALAAAVATAAAPAAAPVPRPAAAAAAPAAAKAPAAVAEKVEIVLTKSARTLIAAHGDFILDVAEEHGVAMANSCRAGNCGTCKVKKNEGEVEMDGQQALSETDLLDGYVLACIGRVCSKRLVIEA